MDLHVALLADLLENNFLEVLLRHDNGVLLGFVLCDCGLIFIGLLLKRFLREGISL
jgi:hypothetical protein